MTGAGPAADADATGLASSTRFGFSPRRAGENSADCVESFAAESGAAACLGAAGMLGGDTAPELREVPDNPRN